MSAALTLEEARALAAALADTLPCDDCRALYLQSALQGAYGRRLCPECLEAEDEYQRSRADDHDDSREDREPSEHERENWHE
jgi:hypothetical protein